MKIQLGKQGQLILGLVAGMALSGVAAYGVGVANTPESGYLLCANTTSKVVTFNGTLKCPTGSTSLELGARGSVGATGARGSNGAQGVDADASQNVFYKVVPSQDIPLTAVANASSVTADFKGVVMAIIFPNDMPLGFYELDAHISGLWKNATIANAPTVSCYFQFRKDYDRDRSVVFGVAKQDFVRWTGINMSPLGQVDFKTLLDDPMYLVCKSSGAITGMSGIIHASPFSSYEPMKSTTPMIPLKPSSY